MENSRRDPTVLVNEGVTLVGPLPVSAEFFYTRMLENGLRLSPEPLRPRSVSVLPGEGLTVSGLGCRGYLLDQDGEEVSETDLHDFLDKILREGDGLNVSGKYVRPGGDVIESDATFLKGPQGIMGAERRQVLRPDGDLGVIKMRSDIRSRNVTPFNAQAGAAPWPMT